MYKNITKYNTTLEEIGMIQDYLLEEESMEERNGELVIMANENIIINDLKTMILRTKSRIEKDTSIDKCVADKCKKILNERCAHIIIVNNEIAKDKKKAV